MTTTESAQIRKTPLSWLAQTLILTNAGLLCLVALACTLLDRLARPWPMSRGIG